MAAQLSAVDYVIFFLLLFVSSCIGFYFAWKNRRKQETSEEYLLANRTIHWFPIFVSMVASYFSAIGVIGTPAQIYATGITFAFGASTIVLMALISCHFYIPLHRRLNLVSVNQYLELRYCRKVRYVGHGLLMARYLCYLSLALYAPSLALNAVAGLSLSLSILSTGIVCTIYTSIGGMRAVIWTDVFQSIVMITGLIVIVVLGFTEVGSLSEIIEINRKYGRLDIVTNLDPRTYHSIWGVCIGLSFSRIGSWTTNQIMMQRAVAARTENHAKMAIYSSAFCTILIVGLLTLASVTIFAVYSECDPLLDSKIFRYDQVLPYFIISKLGKHNGLPGLLIACVFSFALSTLSSGLNGMSALFLKDVIVLWKPDMSSAKQIRMTKYMAIFGGFFITSFAFVIPYLGKYVIKMSIQIAAVVGAPQFALFSMGYFCKRINTTGAVSGTFVGIITGLFFTVGQWVYPPDRQLPPVSMRGCESFNATLANSSGIVYRNHPGYPNALASVVGVSYVWHGLIIICVSCLVQYFVSICTSKKDFGETVKKEYLYDYSTNVFCKCLSCFRFTTRPSHRFLEEVSLKEKEIEATNSGIEMRNVELKAKREIQT